MRRKEILALMTGLLLAGCQQENTEELGMDPDQRKEPYEQLENTADTAAGYERPGAAPVTPVQGGKRMQAPLTATGQFEGVAGGAPPGSVTLTEVGPGTRVSILVNRYTENTKVQAAIVQGACGQPGSIVQRIPGTIEIDKDGVATLEGQVPVPTARLLDGRHSVRLANPEATTSSGEVPEMVMACANLPPVRSDENQGQ